jgi:micrococcal nuclease
MPTALPAPTYTYRARVLRVYDGDTMYVDIDLGFGVWLMKQSLRLSGVNAPEIRGVSDKDPGFAARDFITKCLEASGEEYITISTSKSIDKYGRRLAEVFIKGFSLNQMLIEHGYAVRIEER